MDNLVERIETTRQQTDELRRAAHEQGLHHAADHLMDAIDSLSEARERAENELLGRRAKAGTL